MNTTSSACGERLYFADWLRIGAFALLVLYHVGMLYVPWDFHVKNDVTYGALEPWMRLSNPWRMSLLFVISGLATGTMLGRPGFARERARRLLLPLLFGMVVVVPPQSFFEVVQKLGYAGSFVDFLRLYFSGYHGFCTAQGCLRLPTWNHLWFLPYLWCYTMLLLAALRWLPRSLAQRAADFVGRLSGWRLLVLPIAFVALVRIALFGRFGSTHALTDDWFNHATYLPMFLFGVAASRRREVFERMQALRWPALTAALIAWAALEAYLAWAAAQPAVPDALRWLARTLFATVQWSAVVAAFGFGHRHLNRDHRWRAALTEAVFPLYVVHQTLIIVAFAALRPSTLRDGIEAMWLVVFTFAASLGLWQLARRIGVLRPWLGMNATKPRQSGAPALSSRLTTG